MTQANDTVKAGMVFNVFVSIMLILSIGMSFMSLTADKEVPVVNVDLGEIEARLNAIELNHVETAAGDVTIDTTGLDIAVAKMDGFKNILDDLMDKAYSEETENLRDDGLDAFEDAIENDFEDFSDDFKDYLESQLVGFDKLVKYDYDVDFFTKDFDEDFADDGIKYTILNLGLDDDEDQKILVERQYQIKYELDDSDKVYKVDILISGMVSYDEDEDELEADMAFTLV